MNSGLILDLILIALAVVAVIWAMAERARAARAEADLARAGEQQAVASGAVADALVRRASEAFEAQSKLSQANLEAQLKPVAETLEKFEKKVADADAARAREAGGMKAQFEQLMTATSATQVAANQLSTALRRGTGVQGQWGEQILRNILEQAGLKEGRDFAEQVHVRTADGSQRPDFTVRLPRGGLFIIDSKCSIAAYIDAQQATQDLVREEALKRHASSVRGHVQALAAKAYWEKFETTPDFVVMFVPGDGILAAAFEREPELYALASDRRVILTSPSSLLALCMVVAFGWRVEQQNVNAREIANLGRDLYKRLSVMGGHLAAMGNGLTHAIAAYNKFVGSLETQVLTQARRFEDLKADTPASPLREIPVVEVSARPLTKLALEPSPAALTADEAAPTSAE